MTKRAEIPALSRVSKIKGDLGYMDSANLPDWVVEVDEVEKTDWMTADILKGELWEKDTGRGMSGWDPVTNTWFLTLYEGTVTITPPAEA